jgi:hypothetical protein
MSGGINCLIVAFTLYTFGGFSEIEPRFEWRRQRDKPGCRLVAWIRMSPLQVKVLQRSPLPHPKITY